MKIWIDADACPNPVKDLVYRASRRLQIEVTLVADRPVGHPRSPLINRLVVPRGDDAADLKIIELIQPGDLVITADLPLAGATVDKNATALDPRGELYTEDNVRERVSMRDFMMSLRETGLELGGPAPYGPKDKQKFAAALNEFLSREC